jgi:hypothetical protein
MHRSRRRLIACAAPLLAACASDLSRHRGTSLTERARSLGVCATPYAVTGFLEVVDGPLGGPTDSTYGNRCGQGGRLG